MRLTAAPNRTTAWVEGFAAATRRYPRHIISAQVQALMVHIDENLIISDETWNWLSGSGTGRPSTAPLLCACLPSRERWPGRQSGVYRVVRVQWL